MSEQTARIADAVWLREPALAKLLAALDRDGEEARVVGGAVRNALLGLPHGDIDNATTALPREVGRCPKRSRGAPARPASASCRPASSTAP